MKNKKYTGNKKNGGDIPTVTDIRTEYVPIGCGNCIECRKQKARGWQLRLLEDIKKHKNGIFVTLTFSNESIKELIKREITIKDKESKENVTVKIEHLLGFEKDNAIATVGTRLFLERWRKEYGKSLRHWLVTELGHNGTENIHLHGIIWLDKKYKHKGLVKDGVEEIRKIWKYGYIFPYNKKQVKENYVSARTVNYIIKYVTKQDEKYTTYKSIVLTTPGIGSNYIDSPDSKKNKFNDNKTIETYRTSTGHKIAMPTYWRNKIYSEEEREKLWLLKLDKGERWVRGEKISVKNGEEEYYKLLKWHQNINKELGYGEDKTNWNRAVYERERREIMYKKRIENNNNKNYVTD